MDNDIMALAEFFERKAIRKLIDDVAYSCQTLLIRIVDQSHALTGVDKHMDS